MFPGARWPLHWLAHVCKAHSWVTHLQCPRIAQLWEGQPFPHQQSPRCQNIRKKENIINTIQPVTPCVHQNLTTNGCAVRQGVYPSSLPVFSSTQGGLQLSSTTNNTLMKTLIHTSSRTYVRISLGYISWSGIAGSGGMSILIQLSEASLHSGIAVSSSQAWGPPTTSIMLAMVHFCNYSSLVSTKSSFILIPIYISLISTKFDLIYFLFPVTS